MPYFFKNEDLKNPVGSSLPYRGGVVPVGYLLENGALLNVVDFPVLHSIITTLYNTGGETPGVTFRLPDSRGRVDVGAGTGAGLTNRPLGQSSAFGSEAEALSIAQLPSHNHGGGSHQHDLRVSNYLSTPNGNISPKGNSPYDWDHPGIQSGPPNSTVVQSQGSGSTHNNMPPCLAATKMIKY